MERIILWYHYHASNDNTAQWLQLASIVLTASIFLGNLFWQNHVRRRDILERLNNEIFASCEKIIRCAFECNSCTLAVRKHYILFKKGIEDKEHHEKFYFRFYDEAEKYKMKVKMYQIDLIKTVEDYKLYGNSKDAKEISKLLQTKESSFKNDYDHVFNENMSPEDIYDKYHKLQSEISKFLHEQTICKNLRIIQKIVHPRYPLWEQSNKDETNNADSRNSQKV